MKHSHALPYLKEIIIDQSSVSLAEIITELREYRKTLHERFGNLHERIGAIDERIDDIQIRAERRHEELLILLEKYQIMHVTTRETLATRIEKLESFELQVRTNWKALVTVASGLSIFGGWFLTHMITTFNHTIISSI